MDLMWMLALLITHTLAYIVGRGDGAAAQPPEDETWEAVEKYAIDKRFEHLRWLEERRQK